jgi:hypothetical protein
VQYAQEHPPLLRPFDRRTVQATAPKELPEEMPPPSFPIPQQAGLLDWIDGARAAQAMPLPSKSPGHAAGWNRTPQAVIRHAPGRSAPPAAYDPHAYDPHAYDPHAHYGYQTAEHTPWTTPPAAPAPRFPQQQYNTFIPLRLTDPPQAAPAPQPVAPEPPAEPVPLFPEDKSLLGFILGNPGKHAKKSAAKPPQSTRFAQAARDLVKLVRTKTDAPAPATGHSLPGLRRETPKAHAPAVRDQPASATRLPQAGTQTRPTGGPSGSVAEQMQPLIPGLLAALDEAMDDVRRAFNKADTLAVEKAAERIAARADNYGLRVLARMARCVERAANAQDKEALTNILPDLETAVERNRIALQPKK